MTWPFLLSYLRLTCCLQQPSRRVRAALEQRVTCDESLVTTDIMLMNGSTGAENGPLCVMLSITMAGLPLIWVSR